MEKIKELFEGLRPFQKAEYAIMLALAFAIPFHWFAAQVGEAALASCAILKIIFDQKFTFNKNQLKYSWAYIIFALSWLVYLIGMIYTDNKAVGWAQVSKKLGFLVFPLIFLLSDMSYLTKKRVKAVFYSLTLSCLAFFILNFVWSAFVIIFDGKEEILWFFNNGLMRLYYVHHTYISMYALIAIAFCFVEIFDHKELRIKKISVITIAVLLLLVILLDSRAGILTLALEIMILWFWVTFVKKKLKIGLIAGALVALVAIPYVSKRMDATLEKLRTKKNPDIRMVYIKGCTDVIDDHLWFGVGTGDRTEATMASFERYKQSLIDEVKPMNGVEAYDYALCKDELIYELLRCSRKGKWNTVNKDFLHFIKNQPNEYQCDTESVMGMAAQYVYVVNAIEHNVNAHNQYFDTMISVGLVGLLLMLAHFIVPLLLAVGKKPFGIICLLLTVIVAFNAFFESVFEMQMGIIFFCFFNALLFTQITSGQNLLKDERAV